MTDTALRDWERARQPSFGCRNAHPRASARRIPHAQPLSNGSNLRSNKLCSEYVERVYHCKKCPTLLVCREETGRRWFDGQVKSWSSGAPDAQPQPLQRSICASLPEAAAATPWGQVMVATPCLRLRRVTARARPMLMSLKLQSLVRKHVCCHGLPWCPGLRLPHMVGLALHRGARAVLPREVWTSARTTGAFALLNCQSHLGLASFLKPQQSGSSVQKNSST